MRARSRPPHFSDEIAAAGNYQKVTTLSENGVAVMSNTTVPAGVRRLRGLLAAQSRLEESDECLLHAFLHGRDDGAFTALVRRHGPMVLHVCRRVLGHHQDAEDAFQATFLVLARNAVALRKKSALASWLHGTAYRTAMKAKQTAARRRKHEGKASARSSADPSGDLLWREVQALLDEEIARLPDIYRSAFVLCCLESQSQAEAARRLGLKEGTVSSRLAEARRRLQLRLSRRGVELTALLAATALATSPASALPVVLLTTTTQAAVSPAVAALAGNGSPILTFSKAKLAAALALAMSILSGAGLWLYRCPAVPAVAPPQPTTQGEPDRPKVRTASEAKRPALEVRGRVLDPDGKPVGGAKLLFLCSRSKQVPTKVWASSAADGRFQFSVPKAPVDDSPWESPWENAYIMAAAGGYGFAVAPLDKVETAALTLRLVKDDVPIRGRVLNLEGKPIAGVRVRINDFEPQYIPQLYVPKQGDLTSWLAALKAGKDDSWDLARNHFTGLYSLAFDLLIPPVTTGADGRFEVRGVGRERLVRLRLEGPTVATQIVNAMTRPGEKIVLPLSRRYPKWETIAYHGAALEVPAEPTKPVVGVVRDRDTGRPLAGVTITPNKITNPFDISNHDQGLIQTTTDKEGRYRLVGLPKGEDNQIMAMTYDLPYLPVSKSVENTRGLEAATVDFALKHGVWVTGRVTEQITGKPLAGVVGYYCFRDNPNRKEIPTVLGATPFHVSTREDGSYRVVAVPGHGLIAVQVHYNDRYLLGVGAEQIKGPRAEMGGSEGFGTYPFMCQTWNQNTLAAIDPKPGDESITCDLFVVPGRTMKGTVLGPEGKPLAGARQHRWDTLPGSEFTVWGLPAGKLHEPRVIEFLHEGKKLAGLVTVRGDEKEPLQVRLQPWGVLIGRLITREGDPLTGVEASCNGPHAYTDKEGRFRIEGLTPDIKYKLWVIKDGRALRVDGGEPKDLMLKPGETKDLGELRVKVQE
jgi:RNA polymerase sigma factor (sigma-70 family)